MIILKLSVCFIPALPSTAFNFIWPNVLDPFRYRALLRVCGYGNDCGGHHRGGLRVILAGSENSAAP